MSIKKESKENKKQTYQEEVYSSAPLDIEDYYRLMKISKKNDHFKYIKCKELETE